MVGLGALLASSLAAQASFVSLEPPSSLRAGERATAVALIDLPTDVPVILTPRVNGTALDIVRGRLLRSDALDPDARPLRFRVPLVARSAGTAILRVHVASFRCEGDECEPIEEEASATLRIQSRD